MAVRGDVTINWDLRIIIVDAPSAEISIQDLHDTVRAAEDDLKNMDNPPLISTAGKEALGSGVQVGITATLQNAKLAFEQRVVMLESGTITTPDTNGMTLIDSSATFITNGVEAGDMVMNHTDGSHATIASVDSETQLTLLTALDGGTDNQFDSADSYEILDWVQCNVSGGNLVAVDTEGNEIDPIFPTFGTQVVRTSSSSATLTEQTLNEQTRFLVESQRVSHSAFGEAFYWDPINGSDDNEGTIPSKPKLTFDAVYALTQAGRHDVIYIEASGASTVNITERITLDKAYTFLRGPGRHLRFKPTDTGGPTITVAAEGVELDGFEIETAATGSNPGVRVTTAGEFVRINGCFIKFCTGNGIEIDNGAHHIISDTIIHDCGGDGLNLMDGDECIITRMDIRDNTGDGIRLEASGPAMALNNILADSTITGNGGTDIVVDTNVTKTRVAFSVIFASMTDNGLGTFDGTAGIGGPT